MSRAYLDHASTTPLRPEARSAMVDALASPLGDPSRIHEEGLAARVALEHARDQVALLLGARNREVIFTSSATEAVATAVSGAAARWRIRSSGGPGAEGRGDAVSGSSHQVVTAVEHSAVRLAAERSGPVTVVAVDHGGRVAVDEVLAAITPDTAVVHVQWANHEVGTIQRVAAVVAACRERGVLIHVDAAQAAGRVPIAFDTLGADLLSISGHKLGGPAGTGALLVRRGLRLPPLLVGGDQERARRAGLEPIAALIGLGAACAALASPMVGDPAEPDEADADPDAVTDPDAGETPATVLDVEAIEARRLTDRIRAAVAIMDGIEIYGDPLARLPHLVCLGIADIEPQAVLLGLDRAGIAAHSGSACSSESLEPSPVLEAMGVDAHRSLRLSVGWSSTDADIDRLLAALAPIIDRLRALATNS